MFEFHLPLWGDVAMLMAAAVVIGLAGTKAAAYADQLADRTGLGEAVTGTVFLGLLTALPGLAASVFAALKGHPTMAIANAMGGIAAQTAALAVADIAYIRANLEHAAASVVNMMQTITLILLMVLVVAGISGPNVAVGHVHLMTPVLIAAAGFAFWIAYRTRQEPMWRPKSTRETVLDEPNPEHMKLRLSGLMAGMLFSAGLTALAGSVVAEAAENIVDETTIPEVVVGGLMMALATSLPELVTSIAAVRRGALTLAVSDIVGGNFFDVLFVAAADLVYLEGSLYHAAGVGNREIFLCSFTILLNVVLLIGLIYRQRQGPGNIGFESVLMLILYVAGFLVLSLVM